MNISHGGNVFRGVQIKNTLCMIFKTLLLELLLLMELIKIPKIRNGHFMHRQML